MRREFLILQNRVNLINFEKYPQLVRRGYVHFFDPRQTPSLGNDSINTELHGVRVWTLRSLYRVRDPFVAR